MVADIATYNHAKAVGVEGRRHGVAVTVIVVVRFNVLAKYANKAAVIACGKIHRCAAQVGVAGIAKANIAAITAFIKFRALVFKQQRAAAAASAVNHRAITLNHRNLIKTVKADISGGWIHAAGAGAVVKRAIGNNIQTVLALAANNWLKAATATPCGTHARYRTQQLTGVVHRLGERRIAKNLIRCRVQVALSRHLNQFNGQVMVGQPQCGRHRERRQ